MEQEDEWPTACRAVQGRLRGERGLVTVSGVAALRGLVVAGAGCQERPDLCQCWATARAEDAVGADVDASLGQHVLEAAAHTLFGGQRPVGPGVARALLDADGDGPIFALF